MASTADAVSDSTQNDENQQRDTESLQEFADRDWSISTLLTGRKEKRWLSDSGELYIEKTGCWEDTDREYQVKYREGRFGPSDRLEYGEFNDFENAVEYAEMITEGKADLEETRP